MVTPEAAPLGTTLAASTDPTAESMIEQGPLLTDSDVELLSRALVEVKTKVY